MRIVRILVQALILAALLAGCPRVSFAGDKEDLQAIARDVEALQAQLRQLQQDADQRFAAFTVLFQNLLDSGAKRSTAVAVLSQGASDRLSRVPVPGANLRNANATLAQMQSDLKGMAQSANDVSSRMDRLEQQIQDLAKAVQSLPPSTAGTANPQPAPTGQSPDSLFENARRDQSSGNYTLALQEYKDVVAKFPNSLLAANAQFHIGEVCYFQQQYDDALAAFNTFLSTYPTADRQPDALYMKALTQQKLGRTVEARRTFQELIQKFPHHDLADQARAQLNQN